MRDVDGVRGFARGLEVLRELNDRKYATVLQLSRATNIPRATIYRLLDTLINAGYVRQIPNEDFYHLRTSVSRLSSGVNVHLRITEAADARVKEFNRLIGWPVFVHTWENSSLTTRQVTRSSNVPTGPREGRRVPLLSSSPGRALLAGFSEREREDELERLSHSGENGDSLTRRRDVLDKLLTDVLRRGYGFRDGGFLPKSCSFAVPIKIDNRAEAFITVVFLRAAYSLNEAIGKFLTLTQDLALEIERDVLARDPSGASDNCPHIGAFSSVRPGLPCQRL